MDNTEKRLQEWLGEDNQLGIDIWHKKYQHNDESFDEWLDRISAGDKDIKEEIEAKRFLFGGRILANRGLCAKGVKVTYSNCYVLPAPEDNIESIYDTASKLARTFSYGGGVGIDISKLAPKGARVNNTAKETSGAVSFMDLYGMTTGLIGQNGRRGALMISMDCRHPDLEEFIKLKSDLDKVTTANISIRMDDDFMSAVEHNKNVTLSYARPEVKQVIKKTVNAKEIFDEIAYQNWDMGEPGVLFWDNIKNWNLLSNDDNFEYAGTNPCAEEPLPAGGSCLLGSINLSEFVCDPYTDKPEFDMATYRTTIRRAVRALNDVLDEGLPLHPLQIQRDTVRDWRQIGLGVFGIADMLVKMGLDYGSEKARKFCVIIADALASTAISESVELARKFGAYPKYTNKVFDTPYIKHIFFDENRERYKDVGLRNSQILTIAPTGTLSTMLGVSGGIEPFFATEWERTTKSLHGEDVVYKEHPRTIEALLQAQQTDTIPDYVVTSGDITPIDRIKMQSVWQKYIDASISSTINLPNDTTPQEVADIYMQAWKYGLKGVTIFRDGCRRVAILNTPAKDEDGQLNDENIKTELVDLNNQLRRGDILDVSDDLLSAKRTLVNGCGKMYLHLDFDEMTGEPLETWIECGSGGGCERNLTFISRLISVALRGGIPIEAIIDQAMSIKPCKAYCDRTKLKHDTSRGTSCPQSIGYAMEELYHKIQDRCFADDGGYEYDELTVGVPHVPSNLITKEVRAKVEDEDTDTPIINFQNPTCPECGEELFMEGGCIICKSCGWSRCD